MLKNPEIEIFKEVESIILQVIDEQTSVKVDITKEIYSLLNGKQICELLVEWANKKRLHNDDFHDLFVSELLTKLEEEK